jgi:hypothetical protein
MDCPELGALRAVPSLLSRFGPRGLRPSEISIEFVRRHGYLSLMRRSFTRFVLAAGLLAALSAAAATGRVIKVLPQFLDLKGRASTSPSLYERDAYQAYLRQHTNQISSMVFNVEWKTKGPPAGPIKLRVEARGLIRGKTPEELLLEKTVQPGGWFNHWTGITLSTNEFRKLGAPTAWRVTLWENDQLLGEQRSFLWQ